MEHSDHANRRELGRSGQNHDASGAWNIRITKSDVK